MRKLALILLVTSSPVIGAPPDLYEFHNLSVAGDRASEVNTNTESGPAPVRYDYTVPTCGFITRTLSPSKVTYWPIKDQSGTLCTGEATFDAMGYNANDEVGVSHKRILITGPGSGNPIYPRIYFGPTTGSPGEKDSEVLQRLSDELEAGGR